MGVKNYPANNKPGLGSPVLVATFALKLDPQVKLNIVQMKASLKLYIKIFEFSLTGKLGQCLFVSASVRPHAS